MTIATMAAALALASCAPTEREARCQAPGERAVIRLTESNGARSGGGAYSLDGQTIAFISNRSGGWEVWLMDASGENERRLTTGADGAGWPTWIDRGRRIMYYARSNERSSFFSINVTAPGAAPEPMPAPPGVSMGDFRHDAA